MVLVEAAVQEEHCKERCKQHLCATHHLVHAGCHAQQADVHEHRGDEVKDCGNRQEQELKPRPGFLLLQSPREHSRTALMQCSRALWQ